MLTVTERYLPLTFFYGCLRFNFFFISLNEIFSVAELCDIGGGGDDGGRGTEIDGWNGSVTHPVRYHVHIGFAFFYSF